MLVLLVLWFYVGLVLDCGWLFILVNSVGIFDSLFVGNVLRCLFGVDYFACFNFVLIDVWFLNVFCRRWAWLVL